jgi:hypothetical protein
MVRVSGKALHRWYGGDTSALQCSTVVKACAWSMTPTTTVHQPGHTVQTHKLQCSKIDLALQQQLLNKVTLCPDTPVCVLHHILCDWPWVEVTQHLGRQHCHLAHTGDTRHTRQRGAGRVKRALSA